jgi:nicotinamidase-related amidase
MNATALLVIDMQRGAFDGARCPPIDRASELIAQVMPLVQAARVGKGPVVFVQHCAQAHRALEEGTVHWELHEALVPEPQDKVIRKHASSAFESTGLEQTLRGLNITELMVCGLQSELCVFNTSKSALDLGFVVRIAQDGHATWPSQGKSSETISSEINEELRRLGAVIEPTVELVDRLSA